MDIRPTEFPERKLIEIHRACYSALAEARARRSLANLAKANASLSYQHARADELRAELDMIGIRCEPLEYKIEMLRRETRHLQDVSATREIEDDRI